MATGPELPLLSIVIPARNEEGAIDSLATELRRHLDPLGNWEILLVDDGSTDGTVGAWRRLMADEPRLGLVRLLQNVGKERALLAGFAHARGRAVVPMDADLQDPPALLPEFVARWRDGHDMVFGVRRTRSDPWPKRLLAAAFYRFASWSSVVRVPRDAGDFRLLDRAVVDRLLALPEVDRCTRALYHLVSGSPCAVPYDRPPRTLGRPTYRLEQSIDQAISFISFTDTPLYAMALLGSLVAGGGLLYLIINLARWLVGTEMAWGWPSLMGIVVILGGIQLLAVGILGIYLGRIFREVKRRPAFLVTSLEGCLQAPP